MDVTAYILKLLAKKSGANNFTYVPKLKNEIENYYTNLLDQIRNMGIDICQLVIQVTGDESLREHFRLIVMSDIHDCHRVLAFLETFHSAISILAEDAIEEEHRLRLRQIELKEKRRTLTKQHLTAKQEGALEEFEEILRKRVTAEIQAESRDTFINGSKARQAFLDAEHRVVQAQIQAEQDKAKVNKEVTTNAKDNIKGQILSFYEELLKKHPEKTSTIQKGLADALEALKNIDFE